MLPSSLLRAKITKKSLLPLYVSPEQSAPLARKLVEAYKESVGKKKQLLLEKISVIETEEAIDYKLVRGLSILLERSCVFETRSAIDSKAARRTVFELASKRSAATMEQVQNTLSEASSMLSIAQVDLERSLWADLDDELFLKEFFPPSSPEELIKKYNLSLAQTCLFKCSRMEFTASGNWKNIFRNLKWLGLMYSIEEKREELPPSSPHPIVRAVSLDGPMSLLKMTDRYGVSLAKLFPEITKSEGWTIKAELIDRKKSRVLSFEESSEHLGGLIPQSGNEWDRLLSFDSSVEEKFARRFNALGTRWTLTREPEPLSVYEEGTGKRSVIIPDFSFEIQEVNDGEEKEEEEGEVVKSSDKQTKAKKVYLEIVGFWTNEYMQRKLAKLSALLSQRKSQSEIDLIIAVDESLSCSSKLVQLGNLSNISDRIILYKNGKVPLPQIVRHLESIEKMIEQGQIAKLSETGITLDGEVVSIREIARAHGMSLAAAKSALNTMNFRGYLRVGDYYLSISKAEQVKELIEELILARGSESSAGTMSNSSTSKLGVPLADVVALIESTGLQVSVNELLDVLGYNILWNGLDYSKSMVLKSEEPVSSVTAS